MKLVNLKEVVKLGLNRSDIMKTKEEFRKYYENELINKTDEYSKTVKYYCGIGLLAYFILLYFCFLVKNILPMSLTMLISLGGVLYLEYKFLSILKKKYKDELVFDIVKFVSNNNSTATIQYNSRVARDVLQECGIFNFDKLKFKGSNYTVMRENGYGIVLSDVKLWNWKNARGQAKETFFEGVYFSASFNKPINEFVYLIPNNINDTVISKLADYTNYKGIKVSLENMEFEKKYNVYSSDEIQARYILSLRLMERINDIDNIFKRKKYIVFKQENGKVSIFFEGESIEHLRNFYLPIFNRDKEYDVLERVFEGFNNYIEVYKILDLENKLYMMQ